MNKPEEMSAFFAARVDGYDAHMIANVEGCKEGYEKMAALLPHDVKTLLDLGCGTGLELDAIFQVQPRLKVTGIDLTQEMLSELRKKHADKSITLICGDYFTVDFGISVYDAAVSFETMHHFEKEKKTALYRKLCAALSENGTYIECDYMVETQAEEDLSFAEYTRLIREFGLDKNAYYHYDTPCTIRNQIAMLQTAGFRSVEHVYRKGGTSILIARK